MENELLKKPFDLHVFVCTNVRTTTPAKASCGPLGAEAVRTELKAWLSMEVQNRPELAGRVKVRVNGSGCMDFCKKGIVVASYPQSEFHLFVKNTTESMDALKSNLREKLKALEAEVER